MSAPDVADSAAASSAGDELEPAEPDGWLAGFVAWAGGVDEPAHVHPAPVLP